MRLAQLFFALTLVLSLPAGAIASGTNLTIWFPSRSSFNYQVQYKTGLTEANWNPLADVPGDTLTKSASNPTVNSARFYRVLIH